MVLVNMLHVKPLIKTTIINCTCARTKNLENTCLHASIDWQMLSSRKQFIGKNIKF